MATKWQAGPEDSPGSSLSVASIHVFPGADVCRLRHSIANQRPLALYGFRVRHSCLHSVHFPMACELARILLSLTPSEKMTASVSNRKMLLYPVSRVLKWYASGSPMVGCHRQGNAFLLMKIAGEHAMEQKGVSPNIPVPAPRINTPNDSEGRSDRNREARKACHSFATILERAPR